MLFSFLLTGGIIIVAGLLTGAFPNSMIAGYNTMTPQQKKNVDIKKLSRLLRNNFVVMGSAVIIWGCVSTRTGWPSAYASFIIMIITVIVWIITVVVIAQKYDHNN